MADTTTLTADQVHLAVQDLRARAAVLPEKIELGIAQREALEAEVRAAAGTDDIGPLTSYSGLEIVKSRRQDHVRLLRAGESGEDEAIPSVGGPISPPPEEVAASG